MARSLELCLGTGLGLLATPVRLCHPLPWGAAPEWHLGSAGHRPLQTSGALRPGPTPAGVQYFLAPQGPDWTTEPTISSLVPSHQPEGQCWTPTADLATYYPIHAAGGSSLPSQGPHPRSHGWAWTRAGRGRGGGGQGVGSGVSDRGSSSTRGHVGKGEGVPG
jgi:hypothetical protein